jgi:DNA repair protein RadC
MGKFAANNIADSSYYKNNGLFNSSSRIWGNAGREFLPLVDAVSDRNISTSTSPTSERQRSTLEQLLTSVCPKHASAISINLMKEFGSIGRILGANKEALERVIGPNPKVIRLLHAANLTILESLRSEIPLRLISTTNQYLIDYLVVSMGSKNMEALRVLFLNRTNHLVGDEILASGSLSTMTAYPRNIFKRAFELSANSILLVHNHPGGCVQPSQCDIKFTANLIGLGRSLEIEVKDHLIVAGTRWFSFLRQGLL